MVSSIVSQSSISASGSHHEYNLTRVINTRNSFEGQEVAEMARRLHRMKRKLILQYTQDPYASILHPYEIERHPSMESEEGAL
jgi:hypothetical protein